MLGYAIARAQSCCVAGCVLLYPIMSLVVWPFTPVVSLVVWPLTPVVALVIQHRSLQHRSLQQLFLVGILSDAHSLHFFVALVVRLIQAQRLFPAPLFISLLSTAVRTLDGTLDTAVSR
jgi:hypothetical protein